MQTRVKPLPVLMTLGGLLLSPLCRADASKDDVEYLSKSAQGLMSELKLGAMAQKRASDERVRAFGQQMVADHGKDLQKLKACQPTTRQAARIDGPRPAEGSGQARQAVRKDFDKEYVRYEVEDHRDDIREQKEALDKKLDPALKQFAKDELATVTGHKQKIDALEAALR